MFKERFSNFIPVLLLPTLLLVGCGGETGETKRETDNSTNLSGLWRMNLTSSQSALNATANSSFILNQSSSGLTMTSCNDRSTFPVTRTGNTLQGMPAGPAHIVNNDTIEPSSDYGDMDATKMATAKQFDMGSLILRGTGFGNRNFTDICIESTKARAVGITTIESFSATVIFNSEPMLFEISTPGNLNAINYDITREPSSGEASIRLISDGLRDNFNRTEMSLRDGTLTISEDSNLWLKGSFSANMPNGNAISGSFEFEKP